MMKLIVQIPCFNEEATLPVVVREIPRQIPGIDQVEVLVVDDGSTDRTAEVARECGAEHVVRLAGNKGLATAFKVGLDACLSRGADVIVNTDGDNQYRGADIAALVAPILRGEADVAIGARPIEAIEHFSFLKKKLQRLGSWVIRRVSGTEVPDATSGFRAYSRDAALRLHCFSRFTYTIETIIQAGHSGISVVSVPIHTNPPLRESRLFRGIGSYVRRSLATIARIYVLYRPLRAFTWLGGLVFLAGALLTARFLGYYLAGRGAGKVQSLILAAVLMIIGFQTLVIGVLSDLIAGNRRLLEEALYRTRRIESRLAGTPDAPERASPPGGQEPSAPNAS